MGVSFQTRGRKCVQCIFIIIYLSIYLITVWVFEDNDAFFSPNTFRSYWVEKVHQPYFLRKKKNIIIYSPQKRDCIIDQAHKDNLNNVYFVQIIKIL